MWSTCELFAIVLTNWIAVQYQTYSIETEFEARFIANTRSKIGINRALFVFRKPLIVFKTRMPRFQLSFLWKDQIKNGKAGNLNYAVLRQSINLENCLLPSSFRSDKLSMLCISLFDVIIMWASRISISAVTILHLWLTSTAPSTNLDVLSRLLIRLKSLSFSFRFLLGHDMDSYITRNVVLIILQAFYRKMALFLVKIVAQSPRSDILSKILHRCRSFILSTTIHHCLCSFLCVVIVCENSIPPNFLLLNVCVTVQMWTWHNLFEFECKVQRFLY